MNISTREKLLRLKAGGMRITEVAERSGIPQPTLSRIINGKHSSPLERTVQAVDAIYREAFKGETKEAA